jgi:hypothetical protein
MASRTLTVKARVEAEDRASGTIGRAVGRIRTSWPHLICPDILSCAPTMQEKATERL